MRKPRISDLYWPRILQMITGHEWSKTEEFVERLGDPAKLEALKHLRVQAAVVTAFSDAILFVVDARETKNLLDEGAPLLEMPPLPFQRIVFEAEGDYGVFTLIDMDREGPDSKTVVDFVAISELEEGCLWEVMLLGRVRGTGVLETQPAVMAYRLASDGRVTWLANDGGEISALVGHIAGSKAAHPFMHSMPVELVQLVNARGVSLVDLVDRAERRRAARESRVQPSIYWVDLKSSAETTRGKTDREYHCRWIVRGHWRNVERGRTWIRPYVKGPAGAPWKGRPVYRVAA